MKNYQIAAIALIAGASNVAAWGFEGHETIAYVATNFVASSTKTFFQDILGDTSDDYLASVAAWADEYKYTSAGEFSKEFHYIDALDNPPSACDVKYARDCAEDNCVVSAIVNYTSQLTTSSTSAAEKDIAAKMIIHFVGDVHQPLHDENLDVGGNTVDVTFGGESTNLHAVWDTSMIEKYTGGSALSDAKTFGATLTTMINTGIYKSLAAGWVSDLDFDTPQKTAMVWATDSNAKVCTVVMPDGVDTLESGDLDGSYYTGALPTVKLQLAKAGYRLAKWLDAIAAA